MKKIDGGVCAAIGFSGSGIHAGIRKNRDKKDLALIYSEVKSATACVYTQNLVKGAPIYVTKNNIADGYSKAVICNSGNANTCNDNGIEIAEETCKLLANELKIDATDIVIASTGVIGEKLSIEPFKNGMKSLVAGLGDNSNDVAEAIMTTDTVKKEIAYSFEIDGVECKIGGVAKGSGMIHPNMATMLVFITSDVAITPALLQKALSEDVKTSFNMLSIDGDTSTNDMVTVMANGMAGNAIISEEDENFEIFKEALSNVTTYLCKNIAKDGEGATKMLQCKVSGAKTEDDAKIVAKSVITSSLLKAAMFGSDANWGRVLCAIGYSKADVDITKIDVSFKSVKGQIDVCKNGAGIPFSEDIAKEILLEDEIDILINLNDGNFDATAWGCDLTYDYVKINGDYRT